jgi:cardiolipin synthase (CMP-forming)
VCCAEQEEHVRDFDWGARGRREVVHDRVLTVPNAVSLLRLLGLPGFVWLMIGVHAYGWAVALLSVFAATDWVDGYLARRLGQVSRLGKILDPLVDRLFMATVVLTMWLGVGWLPWWMAALVLGRDAVLVAAALALFGRLPDIAVTKTGKFATFTLMFALPGIMIGHLEWFGAPLLLLAGWLLAITGLVAYYVAGLQYARAAARIRTSR